ncbi:unnamed protein product, partial [Musa textilis]
LGIRTYVEALAQEQNRDFKTQQDQLLPNQIRDGCRTQCTHRMRFKSYDVSSFLLHGGNMKRIGNK